MVVLHASEARHSVPSADAEAARYALLRRLAPSMRHHLVVNLQPIGMIYEVMERRLRAAQPDLAHVHDSAIKINGFARAALNSCLDVVGWLSPDETVGISLREGVRECTGLLATSLGFRGYALRNEVHEQPRLVRRSALRSLLTAALLYTADNRPPPADLVVRVFEEEAGMRLEVAVRMTDGDKGFAQEANYRPLEWRDLQALATAEGADLEREEDCTVIRLPWLQGAAAG
jgi:hypothetical protein